VVRARRRAHAEEGRRQQERIGQILQGLGTSASTLKDMGTSIMGNLAAMGHAVAQDEIIKNSFANYAFEHYEMATYKALMEMAQAAGDSNAPRLLEQSLNEERRMAEWIDQQLGPTIRRYMQLEAAGQKSGV
jgi:ferritin-like metal-binding protein YciE